MKQHLYAIMYIFTFATASCSSSEEKSLVGDYYVHGFKLTNSNNQFIPSIRLTLRPNHTFEYSYGETSKGTWKYSGNREYDEITFEFDEDKQSNKVALRGDVYVNGGTATIIIVGEYNLKPFSFAYHEFDSLVFKK